MDEEGRVKQVYPRDCKDLRGNGQCMSGVYEIYLYGSSLGPLQVYCDMKTMGGGWTVIQKRIDGSLSFDRNWAEFKNGFGSPEQKVWIGNDVINQMTKGHNSSLYVSITLVDRTTLYELYNQFSVFDEAENYKLFLAGPATGTLGDRMLSTGLVYRDLSGMPFSTRDRDNDRYEGNCAVYAGGGGWWFNDCYFAFLNGRWSSSDWIYPWYPPVFYSNSIKEIVMMIRRH
ncbi:ficolin-1-like [Saccostrea echinata]|uniref:ficolin-1-like n=1 Tax=Saccostrea echinata TaxID=191078 RepID=UPI002A81736C|nr:ficolin-1-like [Saccostrea echinata]